MARGGAPPPPSRDEVLERLTGLIEGTVERDEVTDWAMQWIGADESDVDDDAVWKALDELAGADAPSIDRGYLYQRVDFEAWRDALLDERRP